LREFEDPRWRWAAITSPTRSHNRKNGGQNPPKASWNALDQKDAFPAGSTRERERERERRVSDADASYYRPVFDAKTLKHAIPQRKHAKNDPLSKNDPVPLPRAPRQKRLKSTTQGPDPNLILCSKPIPKRQVKTTVTEHLPSCQPPRPASTSSCAKRRWTKSAQEEAQTAQEEAQRRRSPSRVAGRSRPSYREGRSGRPNAPILLPGHTALTRPATTRQRCLGSTCASSLQPSWRCSVCGLLVRTQLACCRACGGRLRVLC
jgi:hypothetical protein